MKPTNNRVYCIGCKRPKMLFVTQAKADNFIKFNRDEIASFSDKVPSRSYYCSFCCGWHVTSIEDEGKAEASDKRDEHTWLQIMSLRSKKLPLTVEGQKISEMLDAVHNLLQQCLKQLLLTNLDNALELYKELVLELAIIEDQARRQGAASTRIDKIKVKIKALRCTFDIIDEYDFDSSTRNLFLRKGDSSKYGWVVTYMKNKEFIEAVNYQLSQLEQAQNTNNTAECSRLCKKVTNTVNNYRGKGFSAMKKELLNRLAELRKAPAPQKGKSDDKALYLSIIELLGKAHQAMNQSDFEQCHNLIKTAECLMPDSSDEVSQLLWAQIQGLRDRL